MKGEAVPIDVGKANDHWFINAASSGFGAEITATTSPELKRLLGPAAYTVMGAILAINLHHYQGRLILPGREITGSGPVAIVGNGRQTGGGIQVAPRACIDDGLLDVLVVRQISPTALLAAARELQQLPPDGEYISYWQTPWLEVHPEEAIPVNLDGEPLSFSTVRYEAVPKAIQLIVPPNCQLLSQRPKLKAYCQSRAVQSAAGALTNIRTLAGKATLPEPWEVAAHVCYAFKPKSLNRLGANVRDGFFNRIRRVNQV